MNYLSHVAATLMAATVLVAGGAGESAAVAAVLPGPALATQAPNQIQLEGCVVNADGRPAALAVQASGTDGRVLASAQSDSDGVFRMQLPAREAVRLQAATAGADSLALLTGASAMTVTGCLRANA